MSRVHDFQTQNEWSKAAGHESFWYEVYRKAFPDMRNWSEIEAQRLQMLGIDRVITLQNGRQLFIDEKKRAREYPDILLEYISNDQTSRPGWMESDKAIDYMAYAFVQSRRVYLFEWRMLRRAWLHFKHDWLQRYPIIEAQNKGYKTMSVAIPTVVLRKSYSLAHVIDV